jgi:hypothetical protein
MSAHKFNFSDQPLRPRLDECRKVLLVRTTDNMVHTNVPHLVVNHSPSGFEFGYAGSGPADLALNICMWAYTQLEGVTGSALKTTDPDTVTVWGGQQVHRAVWDMYQDFKSQFIAPVPHEGGEIDTEKILKWVSTRLHGYYAVKHMKEQEDGDE